MSLPALLLVDDSEAILSYESAALSTHYAVHTARDGAEALARLGSLRPVAVLLDLSMPVLSGDEVLARMKADPALAAIPVIVVSSEARRGEACVRQGADAFLPKPFRAEGLRAVVERVLSAARVREEREMLAVIRVRVGPLELALPLASVRLAALQPLLRPLAFGPFYLRQIVEIEGEPVLVMDLSARLSVEPRAQLVDRHLLLLREGAQHLALSVDRVCEPELLAPAAVFPVEALGGGEHRPLGDLLRAVLRLDDRLVPLLDPGALFSQTRLRRLRGALAMAAGART